MDALKESLISGSVEEVVDDRLRLAVALLLYRDFAKSYLLVDDVTAICQTMSMVRRLGLTDEFNRAMVALPPMDVTVRKL